MPGRCASASACNRCPGRGRFVPGACTPRRHHAGALLRKPRNEHEMTEPPRRVVGKRQVRPNLSRTDFGYSHVLLNARPF